MRRYHPPLTVRRRVRRNDPVEWAWPLSCRHAGCTGPAAGGAVLDRLRQQVEGAPGVRLDQLESAEGVLVRLQVVSVLHLVEAVSGRDFLPSSSCPRSRLIFSREGGARCAHRRGRGDYRSSVDLSATVIMRLSDLCGRCDRGERFADHSKPKAGSRSYRFRARSVGVAVDRALLPLAEGDFQQLVQ